MSSGNGHKKRIEIASVEDGKVTLNVKAIVAALAIIGITGFSVLETVAGLLGFEKAQKIELSLPEVDAAVAEAVKPIAASVDDLEMSVIHHMNGQHTKAVESLDRHTQEQRIVDEGLAASIKENAKQVKDVHAKTTRIEGQVDLLVKAIITDKQGE